MSRRHRPSRLGLKFLAVAAVALAAALALRALLYDTVLPGLLQSPGFESYWYDRYGGSVPKWPDTFEEALEQGVIDWYKQP